jgi:hypothetical protein
MAAGAIPPPLFFGQRRATECRFRELRLCEHDLANIERRLPAASLKDVIETTSSVDHVL